MGRARRRRDIHPTVRAARDAVDHAEQAEGPGAAALHRLQPDFILPSHQDDFFQPFDRGFIFGKGTDFPEVVRRWKAAGAPGRLILLRYFQPWTLR